MIFVLLATQRTRKLADSIFKTNAVQVADFTKHAASDLTKKVRGHLHLSPHSGCSVHFCHWPLNTCHPVPNSNPVILLQLFGGGGGGASGGSRSAGAPEEGFSISKITEGVSSWWSALDPSSLVPDVGSPTASPAQVMSVLVFTQYSRGCYCSTLCLLVHDMTFNRLFSTYICSRGRHDEWPEGLLKTPQLCAAL